MRTFAAALASCVLCALLSLVLAHRRRASRTEANQSVRGDRGCARHPLRLSRRVPLRCHFRRQGRLGGLFAWVLDKQQGLQRMLATSVKGLKTDNPMAGALTLAGLSFLYGILHAVGPGHGKTIISSYVVANEETVKTRGNHLLHRGWPTGTDRGRPRRLAAVRAQCLRTSGQCLVEPAGERELRDDCARRPLPADDPAAALIPELARRARSACGRQTACAQSCRASFARS